MTENASHVVVHHHFDNASDAKLISMTCCIVLSVVVVLILLIILAIIVYMLSQRTKHIPQDTNPAIRINDTLPPTRNNRTASNTLKFEPSNIRRGIINPAASFEDTEMDINSNNRQSIPMATFRVDNSGNRVGNRVDNRGDRADNSGFRMDNSGNRVDYSEDRQDCSSESSDGLCEVLFPQQHEGEVIRDPPPKVVAFAGRVYATSRRNSRPPELSQPSGSGTTRHKSVNSTTLEWDYHESRRYEASNDSEENDRGDAVNICWV